MSTGIEIRKGREEDIPGTLALIKELAQYERAENEVEITEQDLLEHGFMSPVYYGLFVAVREKEVIGIALYYPKYSTWKGPCIFLEDLVVKESERQNGIGKLLFDEVIKIAKEQKVRRLEWQVLDWNEPAIKFYQKLGATLDPEWLNGKLVYNQIQNYFNHL